MLLIRKSESIVRVLNTTFQAYFHVRVALFKLDFLKDPCSESWTSWSQMKAENLRNSKIGLHVPKAVSKLELLASKRNRAFFLGHPVYSYTLNPIPTTLYTELDNVAP